MLEEKKNKIIIDGHEVEVETKRLTFFDIQEASHLFTNGDLNFSNYWRYAFTKWLSCSPSIEIESLTPEEGKELAYLLPDPTEVMEWLVFREAKLETSEDMSMAKQSATNFAIKEKEWSTF
jgi:hypothetical protein